MVLLSALLLNQLVLLVMLFLGSSYAWLYLLWVQLNLLILITHSKPAEKSISNYLVINDRGGKHKSLELVTGWPYFVHVGLWDTSFWWAEIQWILSLIFSFIVWQLCKTHVLCNAAAGGTTESHKSTCYSSPIERLFCLRRGLGRAVPFCKRMPVVKPVWKENYWAGVEESFYPIFFCL